MSGRRTGRRKRPAPSRDQSQARGSAKNRRASKKVVHDDETTVNNHVKGELENNGSKVTDTEVSPANTTHQAVPPAKTTHLAVPLANTTHLEVPPANTTPLEVPPVNTTVEEETPKEVVYKAKLKRDTLYSDNLALKFTDVEYNIGGGYNKRSGIFTAPVCGTYLLWAQIMRTGDRHMGVYIYHSKQCLLRGFATAGSGIHGIASLNGEVYLTKGETVWVAKDASEETRLKGKGFSSFGGTLLKAH